MFAAKPKGGLSNSTESLTSQFHRRNDARLEINADQFEAIKQEVIKEKDWERRNDNDAVRPPTIRTPPPSDSKFMFHLTTFVAALAVVLMMIHLMNNSFIVWGSVIAVALAFGVYHTALRREQFFKEFLMDYQLSSEKAYHRNQSSEEFANAILKKIWSGLAQSIASAQIPALQAVLDSNLPVTLRNKQVSLKIASWNIGSIAPVVPSITVVRTPGPRSVLLELTATLATDEMVMMIDVTVGFGSMHFPVKISNFLFSSDMRIEAILSPLKGMHEWVASFSLLSEPKIDMEVSAMHMPFDAMIFPGIKEYIKFVVAKVINADAFTFPKLLSVTLGGEYLADYSPSEEKQLNRGIPITDLALLPVGTEAPPGWIVINKPFVSGPSALLYINRNSTSQPASENVESFLSESAEKKVVSRGRQLAHKSKRAMKSAPGKIGHLLLSPRPSTHHSHSHLHNTHTHLHSREKESGSISSNVSSEGEFSDDSSSLASSLNTSPYSSINESAQTAVAPPLSIAAELQEPVYICYRQDKDGDPITGVSIMFEAEGEQLPHGWTTVQELQQQQHAATGGDESDPASATISSTTTTSSSLSTLSVMSLTDSSQGSHSAPSSPSQARRHRHSWTKRGPTPTLCFTRKKKAFDGSVNPVVTGLIITTRQKRSYIPSGYSLIKKSLTGEFTARIPCHPNKNLFLTVRSEKNG